MCCFTLVPPLTPGNCSCGGSRARRTFVAKFSWDSLEVTEEISVSVAILFNLEVTGIPILMQLKIIILWQIEYHRSWRPYLFTYFSELKRLKHLCWDLMNVRCSVHWSLSLFSQESHKNGLRDVIVSPDVNWRQGCSRLFIGREWIPGVNICREKNPKLLV